MPFTKSKDYISYFDFSKRFIGHCGSTYCTKKGSEKAKISHKVDEDVDVAKVAELLSE